MNHRQSKQEQVLLISIAAVVMLAGLSSSLPAQVSIEIGPGSTMEITNTIKLEVSGHWTNEGTFVAGNGTVHFNGTMEDQTIANAAGETFHNLLLQKTGGTVQLANAITVNGMLAVEQGSLDLNGNVLTLGPDAVLSESTGQSITGGSGYLTVTKELNAPTAENVGGLGFVITSPLDLGTTTITRQHTVNTVGLLSSIKRSFAVMPTNNADLGATIIFRYDESELNGLTEHDLMLFRSTDGGTNWSLAGGTLDPTMNAITLENVQGFSLWTAAAVSAPAAPLDVVVTDSSSGTVTLAWRMNTEPDFLRYRIYRDTSPGPTTLVDSTIDGATDTSKTFTGLTNGIRYFLRVTAVDSAGNESPYSNEVSATPTIPSRVEDLLSQIPDDYSLAQNYPNPFNPSTVIRYGVPVRSHVKLEVFSMLGQRLIVLVDEEQDARYYEQTWHADAASGIYFYRLEAAAIVDGDRKFIEVKKMLLLK